MPLVLSEALTADLALAAALDVGGMWAQPWRMAWNYSLHECIGPRLHSVFALCSARGILCCLRRLRRIRSQEGCVCQGGGRFGKVTGGGLRRCDGAFGNATQRRTGTQIRRPAGAHELYSSCLNIIRR